MEIDFPQFVAAVGDAIIAVDREGCVILWNPAAERVFGYTADEALGRSLDLIIPERHRDRHWEAFYRVMHSGRTRLGSELLYVTASRKDGRTLRMALTVGVVRAANGAITAIGAILRERSEPVP